MRGEGAGGFVEDGALATAFVVTAGLAVGLRAAAGVIGIAARDAFGGGGHPTTRLLIEAVAARARPGLRMLDAGTGSGIVALVAAGLGMAATGIDRDPTAIARARENARANAAFNALAEVRFCVGDAGALDGQRFDLVAANLFATDLLACLDGLAARLDAAGALIVTGVLLPDATRTCRAAARLGLELVERSARAGWARLSFARR